MPLGNKKMRFVICDECPCLNNDYEQGSDCNLGYEQSYVLVQEEPRTFKHLSPNCELIEIKYNGGVITAEVSDQQPLALWDRWRKMAKANSLLFNDRRFLSTINTTAPPDKPVS